MLGNIGVIWSCASPRRRPGAMGSTMAARFIVPSRAIFPITAKCSTAPAVISYDDAFSPAKTVEQARKIVESDEALLIFQSLGTPTNNAIQKYLNEKKVPQLFVATGATKFGDPKNFPWTMGWQPTYQTEGRIYAKYILQNHPQGKIGILYQNDDSGRDYLKGLKDGLGAEATTRMIVGEIPYEATDPTVDRQIVTLKTLGADIFFNEASPKFAAQAIRKAAEIGWKPVQFLASISNSVGSVLKPAGLENSKGILSTNYLKDPTDPTWKEDPAIKEWASFMDKYFPEGDKTSTFSVYGYLTAQTMVQVLKQCGDELTRENVIKQAAQPEGAVENCRCCCRASRSTPPRGNWSGGPAAAGKWRNLYAINHAQLQAWIEMAHRPLIEINDAAGRQRPHIIYLDDGLLACSLNEGIFRARAILNPAKVLCVDLF